MEMGNTSRYQRVLTLASLDPLPWSLWTGLDSKIKRQQGILQPWCHSQKNPHDTITGQIISPVSSTILATTLVSKLVKARATSCVNHYHYNVISIAFRTFSNGLMRSEKYPIFGCWDVTHKVWQIECITHRNLPKTRKWTCYQCHHPINALPVEPVNR